MFCMAGNPDIYGINELHGLESACAEVQILSSTEKILEVFHHIKHELKAL